MWLEERFPEAAFVTQSGETLSSQSVPGLCTDHGEVREAMLTFYRETAKVARGHSNFHGWDLWSEPHIVNWTILKHVSNVQFCHCESTRRRFQLWLRERYETIENLGRAWGRHFSTWDQIRPPQFGTILTYTDFLDWKVFVYEKMAEDLRMRAEAVREVDPDHVITSHAAVPSGLTSPLSEWGGYGATDDFLMARAVDHYGLSLYPKHSFPERHWEDWKVDFALNFAHSASRRSGGFVVGELQAGAGTRGVVVGDPVTAADLRRWMWRSVARGAKAVNLYAYHPMTSGYESGGYGLIHVDGSLTERAQEAGKVARLITRNMEIFAHSRPLPAQVAIVYNPLSQLVGGEQSCGPTSLHTDSLVGYQTVYARHHVPIDFIHRIDLETDDLSSYCLLIVPHSIMLTRSAAEGLSRFVQRGGHVLAEARLAWNDERGFISDGIPGLGLSEVFGSRESWAMTRERVSLKICETDHPVMNGIAPGSRFTGAHFGEALEPLADAETEVLARLEESSPVVVAGRFGEGQTLLVGTFLGLAQCQAPEDLRERFFINLLGWAGVSRPVTISVDDPRETPISVHLHTLSDGHLMFLINGGSAEESIVASVRTRETVDHVCLDVTTDESRRISPVEGEIVIETRVGPGVARVFSLKAARPPD
jgi:beta-galactosidase